MTRDDLEKLDLLVSEKPPGGEFTLKRTYWQLGHADSLRGAGFIFGDNEGLAVLLAAAPELALACLMARTALRAFVHQGTPAGDLDRRQAEAVLTNLEVALNTARVEVPDA